jgi:hypothetical protein
MRGALAILLALPLSSCSSNTPTPTPTPVPRVETRLLAKINKFFTTASKLAFEISNPTRHVFSERVSVAVLRSSVDTNAPASPGEGVRAPIDPRAGTPLSWEEFDPTTGMLVMEQSVLHVKPGEQIRATVDLANLRWGSRSSTQWPDGRYNLWIEVLAFTGPEPRQTRSQGVPVQVGKPPSGLVGHLDAARGPSRVRLRIENVSEAEVVYRGATLWLRPVPKSGQIRPDFERRSLAFSERDDLYAFLDLTTGRSSSGTRAPTHRLRSGAAIEKTIDLGSLEWGRVLQPIWPESRLDEVAPPGRYRLWLDIGHGSEWNVERAEGLEWGYRSDAVTVEVRAFTGPKPRQTPSRGVPVESRKPGLAAQLDAASGASRVALRIENVSGPSSPKRRTSISG